MARDLDFNRHSRQPYSEPEPTVVRHIPTTPKVFSRPVATNHTVPDSIEPKQSKPIQSKRSTFLNSFSVIVIFVIILIVLVFVIYLGNKAIAPSSIITGTK
jgi:hypothetical protein